MINIIEMSEITQFIQTVEDEKMHNLLHKLQNEYYEYQKIGTVEDFKNFKMLCDVPMSQVNTLLKVTNESYRDEITALKEEIKVLKQIEKGDKKCLK